MLQRPSRSVCCKEVQEDGAPVTRKEDVGMRSESKGTSILYSRHRLGEFRMNEVDPVQVHRAELGSNHS